MFNSSFNQSLSAKGCNPSGKFFIIVHGWMEELKTVWVQDLISNLTVYRGGCIMFMDYSNFSQNPNYFLLTPQFHNISDKLLRFMEQLEEESFDFENNGYMFGFSFGAWLAVHTAKRFGEKRFAHIDGDFFPNPKKTCFWRIFNFFLQFVIQVGSAFHIYFKCNV